MSNDKGYTIAEAKAKLAAELDTYIDFNHDGDFITEEEYQDLKDYLIQLAWEQNN
ncbi:hypothetical protein QY890_01170 [Latilactobacillus sakei]